MEFRAISEIFEANAASLARLADTVADISDEESRRDPGDGAWAIQNVLEHVAIVDGGIARICKKLIDSARVEGRSSEGPIAISDDFWKKAKKLEKEKVAAPERVRPEGGMSIAAGIAQLRNNQDVFASLRDDFEKLDLTGHTFPHPYLGDLTAAEWLVVAGAHQARHTEQIIRAINALRHEKSPG